MEIAESRAHILAKGLVLDGEKIENTEILNISFETLSNDYPLFFSSLLSLIKSSESVMNELIK